MTEDELIAELERLKRRFFLFRPRVRSLRSQRVAPVATPSQVERAESRIGFSFPALLRRVYTEIGNGGFGPGYGLFGIEDGNQRKTGLDVVDGYLAWRQKAPDDSAWDWPEYVVPLFDWGGFVVSCGDFSATGCPIVEFDPTIRADGEPMAKGFRPQAASLHIFLERWILGEDVALPHVGFSIDDLRALAAIPDEDVDGTHE